MRIALVTCAALPELDPDDHPLIGLLEARGAYAEAAVWDDTAADWATFDLAVLRNPWDYTSRRGQFVTWALAVPRLANPADIVEWNTDKRYLRDIADAGLPVVPTSWITNEPAVLPAAGAHVLKPAVGAGSIDAARFSLHDQHEAELARAHAARLISAGHTVMVQPYLDAIDEYGETGLIFVGGVFSHAISKGAMLAADRGLEAGGLYKGEKITASEPTPAELELARRALAAVPGGAARLLYARVDLVPGADGSPVIMELELTEPSLFMHTAPGATNRFADAIAAAAVRDKK